MVSSRLLTQGLTRDRVFNVRGIRHSLRRIQQFQPHDMPIFIVVENDARLVFIALLDGRVVEEYAQHVHFGIVCYFHGDLLQYLSILDVRYTVTTIAGSIESSTITRSK